MNGLFYKSVGKYICFVNIYILRVKIRKTKLNLESLWFFFNFLIFIGGYFFLIYVYKIL